MTGSAVFLDGVIADDIRNGVYNIAHGLFQMDKNFINRPYTGEELITMLSTFARGAKDGKCILQGAVVAAPSGARGTQRTAVNMTKNCLLMADFDQGDTVDEIIDTIRPHNLFAVVWTTHSHMKTQTTVAETDLLLWLRTKGVITTDATEPQVIEYMRDCLKIYPKYVTEAKLLGREQIAGGRVYRMQHAPLPRCRALFLLKDKFDFGTRAGSQKDVIDEWKSLYAGFCENVLKIVYDKKCVDPSRLMFLPRIADDADISIHEIKVLPGGFLDLESVTPAVKGRVSSPVVNNAFTSVTTAPVGQDATTAFRTPNLIPFLSENADDFEAESWLEYHDEAKLCPFSDRHTPSASGVDLGFKAWNASGQESNGFGMQCSHTCGADPTRGQNLATGKQDRAKYLDALCVKYGVGVDDLIQFCPSYEQRKADAAAAAEAVRAAAQQQVVAAEATGADQAALERQIAAFNGQTTPAEVALVLRALATVPQDNVWVGPAVGDIITNTGGRQSRFRRVDLDRNLAQMRTAHAALIREAATTANGGAPEFLNGRHLPAVEEEALVICHEWNHDDQVRIAMARFSAVNRATPLVFRFDKKLVRVVDRAGLPAYMEEMTNNGMWASALRKAMRWSQVLNNPDGTVGPRGVAPFDKVVEEIAKSGDLEAPEILRIGHIPVFGPDGVLRTQRGYDHDLRVWLDPEIECRPVTPKPSVDEVEEARWWLEEAVCDFPFSDAMDGRETLPVKVGPADERGYRQTNFERGVSSRTNMISAILLPFVREMIDGPCPAYHIDKPIAGSGAGYMADCISIIAEGSRAAAQPMSGHNEEFRKAITASLKDGAGIIFIDNISRKVDSGELAAALTAGVWTDRILGKSDMIRIPMKAMWLFAGNNTSFTAELMRRNIPARIDAKVENATRDRGQEMFKHYPYQPWVVENRTHLVWACHTIIQHWIATGKKDGGATFHSFDSFAAVMSGIMHMAGFDGFLANIDDYLTLKGEDVSAAKEWAQACLTKYGLGNGMQFKDMVAACESLFGGERLELPIRTNAKGEYSAHGVQGGHPYIRSDMVGKVWDLKIDPKMPGATLAQEWAKEDGQPEGGGNTVTTGNSQAQATNEPGSTNLSENPETLCELPTLKVTLTCARTKSPVKYEFSRVSSTENQAESLKS